MCERKELSNPEKDLERIEMQMTSERFDWFAFRCEVAKELYVSALSDADLHTSERQIAKGCIQLADALIEELKMIQ